MTKDTPDAYRFEDMLVYAAEAAPGQLFELRQDAADGDDLLFALEYGAASLRFGGSPVLDVQGTLLIPHGADYSLFFSEAASFVLVSFRLSRNGERVRVPRELPLKAPLTEEFREIKESVGMTGVCGEARRQALLYRVLQKILPQLEAELSPDLSRIAPGVLALEEQFLNNTPVSAYAALCGLRENRFRLLFTERFGMSPVEYRNTLRMRYAHALMDRLHCTVAEAARAAGFASTSYFCRLHRKMFGVSPAGMEEHDGQMDEMDGQG